jgi:hypothetical protein
MTNYAELLRRLQSLIGDDMNDDNIYRQSSNAIECLLAQTEILEIELSVPEEPTDHEAEGAMLYVMSRGR